MTEIRVEILQYARKIKTISLRISRWRYAGYTGRVFRVVLPAEILKLHSTNISLVSQSAISLMDIFMWYFCRVSHVPHPDILSEILWVPHRVFRTETLHFLCRVSFPVSSCAGCAVSRDSYLLYTFGRGEREMTRRTFTM